MIQLGNRSTKISRRTEGAVAFPTTKILVAICASNIVGMAGYLALSIWILQETNSYVLSSALFGCLWILPLVWPTGIARLTNNEHVEMIAARSEWGSAVLSAALIGAVATKIVSLVLILVIIRGFCDSLTRTSASLIVKLSEMNPDAVERNISQIEFWRIVGTSAAGVLFGLFGERSMVEVFLISSCVVYILTGGLFRNIKHTIPMTSVRNHSQPSGFATLRQALYSQPPATIWLWQLAIVASFQGIHNAIRVAYPDQQLGQGVAGVGIVSTVSTLGVLCGGWLASRNKVIHTLKSLPGGLLIAGVGLTGTIAVFVPVVLPSYAIYFAFMILFEMTFMVFNLHLVTLTDQHYASALLGFRTTLLNASTLLGLVITSVFLSKFSAAWSTLFTASLLIAFSLGLTYQYKHRKQR